MSVTDRQLNGRTYDTTNFYPLTMLSLNELFRESMRKVQSQFNGVRVVVRCENLPQVKGNSEHLNEFFLSFFQTIFSKAAPGAQLFLYVHCEETEEPVKNAAEGFKKYLLKFRTNIPADTRWNDAMPVFEKLKQILLLHNATLLVNNGRHGTSLFSISLPGKF